jgi:hypothetical protein
LALDRVTIYDAGCAEVSLTSGCFEALGLLIIAEFLYERVVLITG